MSSTTLTATDIETAYVRIKSGIYYSPCPESIPLSAIAGCKVHCKLDYLQRTGSFKERGARNSLMLLSQADKKKGVIAASAGNHALGLSYHGKRLGIPVTVVMPTFAPLVKVSTCEELGAKIVQHGDSFDDARRQAQAIAQKDNIKYIHAFDDPHVMAGQGTMGLEILEQVPDVEAIVVPVGGGGLASGIATYVKERNPSVKIYGVEPERAACMQAALDAGKPVPIEIDATIADGLAVAEIGALPFEILSRKLDGLVTVSEDAMATAVLRIVEKEKGVVEGAGAAPLAACLSGKLPQLKNKKVVLPLCGGNIDPLVLSRVVDKALVSDGRLCRINVAVPDRPGWLGKLGKVLGGAGANIEEIVHERAFSGADVTRVNVRVTVETRNRKHIDEVKDTLRQNGFSLLIEA